MSRFNAPVIPPDVLDDPKRLRGILLEIVEGVTKVDQAVPDPRGSSGDDVEKPQPSGKVDQRQSFVSLVDASEVTQLPRRARGEFLAVRAGRSRPTLKDGTNLRIGSDWQGGTDDDVLLLVSNGPGYNEAARSLGGGSSVGCPFIVNEGQDPNCDPIFQVRSGTNQSQLHVSQTGVGYGAAPLAGYVGWYVGTKVGYSKNPLGPYDFEFDMSVSEPVFHMDGMIQFDSLAAGTGWNSSCFPEVTNFGTLDLGLATHPWRNAFLTGSVQNIATESRAIDVQNAGGDDIFIVDTTASPSVATALVRGAFQVMPRLPATTPIFTVNPSTGDVTAPGFDADFLSATLQTLFIQSDDANQVQIVDSLLNPIFHVNSVTDRVGIGTNSPSHRLTVIDTSGIQVRIGYDASNRYDIHVDASGNASLTSIGNTVMTAGAGMAELTLNATATTLDNVTAFHPVGTGNTTLGTSSVRWGKAWGETLDLLDTSTPQIKFAYDASNHIQMYCASNGDLSIVTTGSAAQDSIYLFGNQTGFRFFNDGNWWIRPTTSGGFYIRLSHVSNDFIVYQPATFNAALTVDGSRVLTGVKLEAGLGGGSTGAIEDVFIGNKFGATMVNGDGLAMKVNINNGAGSPVSKTVLNIETSWKDATPGSEDARVEFKVISNNTSQIVMTFEGSASGDMWGLFGSVAVQQNGTGETVGFAAGVGTGVNDDSTFTGNVGATAYRISDVVKALKNYGILAS